MTTASSAAPLSCSGATVDISPQTPVTLAGYSQRRVSRSTAIPLELNAVLLSGGGTRVLFLSADLLFIGPELSDAVIERARHHGLREEAVVVSASHTHFAPATDRTKPGLGVVDPAYLAFVIRRSESLVDTVMAASPVAVTLVAARVEPKLNVSRRRRWSWPTVGRGGVAVGHRVVMAPAYDEPCDGSLDALRAVDHEGRTVAVLWKYACHPVSCPDRLSVTAEFPGRARDRLRGTLGKNLSVVFWQGFAGDVRPNLIAGPSVLGLLRGLVSGPAFGEVSFPAWSQWADQVADALVAAEAAPGVTLPGPLTVTAVAVPLDSVLDLSLNPQLGERPLRIQRVGFGGGTSAVFVSAEVCSPYLGRGSGDSWTICAGYTREVFGYLPSERQAAEGGYEGGGFFASFGLRGPWVAGFERVVRDALARVGLGAAPAVQARSSSIG